MPGPYEPKDSVKTTHIVYDVPVSRDTPIFRFPVGGRVVGAYFTSGFASSGTNLLQVGLRNGGPGGVGTVQTAPQSTGTVVAGSAYQLAVATTGPEVFQQGDWLLLNVTTLLAQTDAIVQIDYHLDQL